MRSSLLRYRARARDAPPTPRTPACRGRSVQRGQGRRSEARQGCGQGERRGRRAACAALDLAARKDARLHRDAGPPDDPRRQGRADREHVLHGLYGAIGAGGRVLSPSCSTAAPDRRPCGCTWASLRADEGRRFAARDDRRPAVPLRRQPGHFARPHRPRVHRRADDRALARARQGGAEGFLRSRQGPRRLHPDDPALPDQIRPLEQPQVHYRRKLRNDPRRGTAEVAVRRRRAAERNRPRLDDPRTSAVQGTTNR